MNHVFAVVLFAIVAGLVSCEVASESGVRGIPDAVRKTLGLPQGGAVVAKIQSVGIEGADVKANVVRVASETKAIVADITDRAIEAAQPDRSESVTPQPLHQITEQDKPQPKSTSGSEENIVSDAGSTSASSAAAPGTTHFYGSSGGTAVAAWAGAATMNPDYESADATGNTPVAAEPAEAVVAPTDESAAVAQSAPQEQLPAEAQAEQQTETEVPAASAESQAAPEAAPVSLGGVGQTSYLGFANKPDADQPWAAAATANPDYTPDATVAEAAAPAEPEPAITPPAAAPAELPPTISDDPPPASLGGTGQTSYYGFAKMPDADQPWAAAAKLNADYTPEAVPEVDVAAPAPAAAPAPQVAPEEPAATVEDPAPASLGGTGQSSNYGVAEKPDATQPWAAAAAPNPDYAPDVAESAVSEPALQEAVEACRDVLNTEAETGGLTFALTRWDISQDKYRSLDKLAKLAKDCGEVIIEVRGHTDSTGKPDSNKTLSELRAKAVVTYLTKAGVPLSKLKAVGLGEDKPVGDNATAAGRRQNRRIEFVVTGG